MIDYDKDPAPLRAPTTYVWIVLISDRPPMPFATRDAAMRYIEKHLLGLTGKQERVGLYKSQVAA